MEVNLDIKDMKDFHPDQMVNQVEPMKQLLEGREKLKQLKLQVLKDVKFRKAIESVLKEGSGSIDDLVSKLSSGEAEAEKEKPKK
jgi:type VI secretion system protein ImpB